MIGLDRAGIPPSARTRGGGIQGSSRVAGTAENVEFVRRFFEELNARDVEALLARLTPEFVMAVPEAMGVEPRTYHGAEGVSLLVRELLGGHGDPVESHDLIAVGDRVVAPHTLHARGRETGIETEQYTAHVWHLCDGKAEMLEVFATLGEGLAAAQA